MVMSQVISDSLFMAISHRWCGQGIAYPKRVDHFLYICATRPELILNALEWYQFLYFNLKKKVMNHTNVMEHWTYFVAPKYRVTTMCVSSLMNL